MALQILSSTFILEFILEFNFELIIGDYLLIDYLRNKIKNLIKNEVHRFVF